MHTRVCTYVLFALFNNGPVVKKGRAEKEKSEKSEKTQKMLLFGSLTFHKNGRSLRVPCMCRVVEREEKSYKREREIGQATYAMAL